MELSPYLMFDGRCEAAFRFYEQCLGAKVIMMMTYDEAPAGADIAPNTSKKVMHARLAVGDRVLMGSDAPADRFRPMQGFSITLSIAEPAEAERVFDALAKNGKINMPMAETFWAKRFGMVVDQFGTPWMVNCEKPRT